MLKVYDNKKTANMNEDDLKRQQVWIFGLINRPGREKKCYIFVKMSELNVEPKQRKIRNPKEPLPFSPRVTRSQKK